MYGSADAIRRNVGGERRIKPGGGLGEVDEAAESGVQGLKWLLWASEIVVEREDHARFSIVRDFETQRAVLGQLIARVQSGMAMPTAVPDVITGAAPEPCFPAAGAGD